MKKYYYLHREEIFEFEEELSECYLVSTNIEDQDTHFVLITEEEAKKRKQAIGNGSMNTPEEEIKEKLRLKIEKSNPFISGKEIEEIKSIDTTLLNGLTNQKRYSRGYKIYSKFYDTDKITDKTVPAVEHDYSLIYKDGILVGEKCLIIWYNEDDTIAFTKVIIENYSAKDAAKVLKDIRETRILYLQNPETEYINATVKKYISMLFDFYKEEVSDYILSGSNKFEKRIKEETNANILKILGAKLADGKTVKESILYQIEE